MAGLRDPKAFGPKEKVLLVEGDDDQNMIWQLLDKVGIHTGVQVVNGRGYTNVRRSLATRLKTGDETHLGILVDADTDPIGRWQSLRDVLVQAGYVGIPEEPVPGGGIFLHPDPDPPGYVGPPYHATVGLWMMPDNTAPGMLEDFARSLIPAEDRLWERAEQAVEAIPPEERLFHPPALIKAKLHTWLAWQADPGKPIGQAIKIGFLLAGAESAQALVAWLQGLFGLELDMDHPS